jgi:periplasmic protein CpxP/Spy
MNDSKGMRIWQWTVILLVLCNVGLIVTIWLRPMHGQPPGGGPRNFVIEQLKFTDDQVKKYDDLIKSHQGAMRRLKQTSSELQQKLFRNLANEQQNNGVADSISRQLAATQQQIEMVTYNHFLQVRALCTDQQKKEFDNIIGDVLKKMNGGPGAPPPGGRPGPPDRGSDGPPPGPNGDGPPRDGPPPRDR